MPQTPKSKKLICLEDLRRRILTQDLEPASYLDEVQLAVEYDISRPPLREVLNQLAGEEYVVLHKNRGAQVMPMSHKTLRNFFVAAPMLYAAVARLAAEHATMDQVDQLRAVQADFRAAIDQSDGAERSLLNLEFHRIIGDMADNEYLAPSYRRLLIDHTRIGMTFYNPRNAALSKQRSLAADHHDDFITLIQEGDADGAAALAIAHWDLSRSEIENFATPVGLHIPLGSAPSGPN